MDPSSLTSPARQRSIETPPASIIIPAHGDAKRLARLLASLDALEGVDGCEIIIVDDCSPDDTGAVVRAWQQQPGPFEKRYIRLPVNRGPAHARNEGLRAARSSIVAFTDSDCVATPDWLRCLLNALDTAPNLAGIGGTVLPLNPRGLISRFFTFFGVLDPPPSLLYVVTANCCMRRDPVLEVGGFNETFRYPGGEDSELSYRLWMRGWRFARAESAIIYHDYREDLKAFRRTWWNYGYGSGYINTAVIKSAASGEGEPGEPAWTSHVLAPCPEDIGLRCAHLWSVFKGAARRYRSLGTAAGLVLLRMAVWRIYARGYRSGELEAGSNAP